MFHFFFCYLFFFFNDTATTEIYTLSLHDALPIRSSEDQQVDIARCLTVLTRVAACPRPEDQRILDPRSEEHTSELQSRPHLVCRLLLEKKKTITQDEEKIRKQKKTRSR